MIRIEPEALKITTMHAEAAYPEECCGALLGTVTASDRHVSEVLPLDNCSREERRRRFVIDPEAYRMAERRATDRGLVLIGFYHSHPDHPARPSAYDLEHALPWHSYVIIAVEAGRAAAWTSWILAADRQRFEPEPAVKAAAATPDLEEGAA